jgi:hypothetical protein
MKLATFTLATCLTIGCQSSSVSTHTSALLDNERVGQWTTNDAVREFPVAGLLDTRLYEDGIGADPAIWWGRHLMTRAPDGTIWFTKSASDEIARVPATLAPGGGGGDANADIGEVDFHATAGALPSAIVATNVDEVWFTEMRAGKVGRVRDGVVTEYALPSSNSTPTSIAAAADGTLWIAESGTESIARVTLANDEVAAIDEFPVPDDQPRELTVGGDGNVYIAAAVDIFVMAPSGGLVNQFSLRDGSNVIGEGGDFAVDAVTAPTGEVYVLLNYAALTLATPSTLTPVPGHLIAGDALTFGPDGKLWGSFAFNTEDDIPNVCDDPTTTIGLNQVPVSWYEPYLNRSDLAHGTAVKVPAQNIAINDSKCQGNKIRGIAGSAPSDDARTWKIFFLETWTGHLGVLDIDPCEATGSTCGTQTVDNDTFSCGTCDATGECVKEEPPSPGWACCEPVTCESAGAHCGTISDNCVGTLDCGTCAAGARCDPATNQCVTGVAECKLNCSDGLEACEDGSPASECLPAYQQCLANCECVPTTCSAAGAQCGTISNGCTGTLDCGGCAAGYACDANQCECVPTGCNGRCGIVSNGCGGTISCGSCNCTPSCSGKKCGASDGCGGTCYGYCTNKGTTCQDDDGVKHCVFGDG